MDEQSRCPATGPAQVPDAKPERLMNPAAGGKGYLFNKLG